MELNKINNKNLNKNKIIKIIKEIKPILKNEYNINKIGIFGSYSRDQVAENSDLDIVVQQSDPDLFDLIGAKQFIEELLNINVDIVRYRNKMNKTLKDRIEKEAIYV